MKSIKFQSTWYKNLPPSQDHPNPAYLLQSNLANLNLLWQTYQRVAETLLTVL